MIKSKKNLLSNAVLKIIALILGYVIWLILAQNQTIEISQNIPLSFDLAENKLILNAPSELKINLLGKRKNLQMLEFNQLMARIDASNLKTAGTYPIEISREHIFLPNQVKLLYYSPVMINLELSEHE